MILPETSVFGAYHTFPKTRNKQKEPGEFSGLVIILKAIRHDHRFGHLENIFPDRQELAFAQTASRSGKIFSGWPQSFSLGWNDDQSRNFF
jgi:hypothetical protein